MAGRNEAAQFITIRMAMRELNMCRASTMRLAVEAGALLKYGNTQRIDWDKLKTYFKENHAEKVI